MKFKKFTPYTGQFFFLFLVIALSQISAQIGDVAFVHDPCIIKCGEYYYVFSTGNRIDIRRSADLLNWKFVGSVFDNIPAWGVQEVPGVNNIWAPDIFYHDSTYYLYYTLSTFGSNHSRIGLATNITLDPDNPNYKWINNGKVIQSDAGDNFNAIDPNVVMDKDNRIWLSFGSFWDGIKLVELDSNTWKPKQNYKLYSIASRSGGALEAPYIIYKNDNYYLFVSFDYCCKGVNSTYNIRVGRSREITGPYIDSNGIEMMKGGGTPLLSGDERWKGPGHCAVLSEENTYWLIFHAYDAENYGISVLRILPLDWDSNDWPIINIPLSVGDLNMVPDKYFLYPNYPNPFNPFTKINYTIPELSFVKLKVYNLLGEEMASLVNGEKQAGKYEVRFNGSNLPSGIYIYTMQAIPNSKQSESFSDSRKFILLK